VSDIRPFAPFVGVPNQRIPMQSGGVLPSAIAITGADGRSLP
jgi:hypothetical protein